jgi:protein TonB
MERAMQAPSWPLRGWRWSAVGLRIFLVLAAHAAAIVLLVQARPDLPRRIEPVLVTLLEPEPIRAKPVPTPPAPPRPTFKPPPLPPAAPRPRPRQPASATQALRPEPIAPATAPEPEAAPAAAVSAPTPAVAGPPSPVAVDRASELPKPVAAPRFDAAYLNNPRPEYPRVARRLGEQGRVLLRVFVTAAGLPEKVEIRSSSGSPRLDQAARDAVRNWKFVPARRGDEAIGAWVVVPITFVLEG